ncbi:MULTISPECIES: hypothetical protein [Nostocales]|uniref:CopG family transcriptional regulator n=3 Tax=Nostocales TaxID=1161 RepID=A0A8S9TCF1_9CYAN|nr:hypothetical protein [Tolypothrix bouteillei]KAF3890251.1 CopG family transcriptional regulator [Tolypothrix bouteillei VB521301]
MHDNKELVKGAVFDEPLLSPTPHKKPTSKNLTEDKNKTVSEKFKVAPKEPTVGLTADLAENQQRKLSIFTAKNGRKKAEIVKMLLDEALVDIED